MAVDLEGDLARLRAQDEPVRRCNSRPRAHARLRSLGERGSLNAAATERPGRGKLGQHLCKCHAHIAVHHGKRGLRTVPHLLKAAGSLGSGVGRALSADTFDLGSVKGGEHDEGRGNHQRQLKVLERARALDRLTGQQDDFPLRRVHQNSRSSMRTRAEMTSRRIE